MHAKGRERQYLGRLTVFGFLGGKGRLQVWVEDGEVAGGIRAKVAVVQFPSDLGLGLFKWLCTILTLVVLEKGVEWLDFPGATIVVWDRGRLLRLLRVLRR